MFHEKYGPGSSENLDHQTVCHAYYDLPACEQGDVEHSSAFMFKCRLRVRGWSGDGGCKGAGTSGVPKSAAVNLEHFHKYLFLQELGLGQWCVAEKWGNGCVGVRVRS